MTEAVRKRIWEGSINVRILLSLSDNISLDLPAEYLRTIPRISYLPLYLPEIISYFKPFIVESKYNDTYEWWFEFEGVPLKWNWPIGLSFDLLTGLDPSNGRDDKINPFNLILNYKDYPKGYLAGLDNEKSIEDMWWNQFKESCFVRNGNAKDVMNLSKDDSTRLWKSVKENDFYLYWSIVNGLLPSNRMYIRHIPAKLYLPVSNNVLQAPINLLNERGDFHTLGTTLHYFLPELFPSPKRCIIARPLIHGIIVRLSVPLVELLYNSMYTDGFLHITVVMMR